MNPFKHKQLEEFTIEDCELYISRYPYGEHTIEVKQLLKELKKQKAKQVEIEKTNDSKKTNVETKYRTPAKEISDNHTVHAVDARCNSGDDWIKLFRIIGTIIVIVIAIAMATAVAEGYVYTGPPIALVAFWVIRAIWKDS